MEHHETVPMEEKLVSKYMIAYADIWADVILNKNLVRHLTTIEDDLKHLNEIIDGKEALNCNALGFTVLQTSYTGCGMLYPEK